MNDAAGLFGEISAAVVALLLVVAFFGLRPAEDRRALLKVAVSSYLLRAALVPIYFWILEYGGLEGFAYQDSIKYHETATEMAFEIAEGLPKDSIGWGFNDPAYSFICALLYIVFGPSTLVPRFFNAAVGVMTILYVHRIAKTAFDERVARSAVLLWAFLPYTIFLTINQVKDGWVILLATLLFWHGYRATRELPGWPKSLASTVLGLFPMYFLREGFILPFAAVMLLSFVFAQRSFILGAVLAVFVFIGLGVAQIITPEENEFTVAQTIDSVQAYFNWQTYESESGGLLRFAKMTAFYEIYKLPLAAFLLTIMPFPPNIDFGTHIHGTVLSFSQLVSVLLLPQLLLGVRECFRSGAWRRRLPLFIYAGTFIALLGAVSVGVVRYRETVSPLLAILMGAGIRARQNVVLSLAVYLALLALASLLYFKRFA